MKKSQKYLYVKMEAFYIQNKEKIKKLMRNII